MPIWLLTLASMSPQGTQMFCSGMCAGAGLLGFTVLQTCVYVCVTLRMSLSISMPLSPQLGHFTC